MGGVLFIDEAYSLLSVAIGNDFGREAIKTLLTATETHRNAFVVIAAVYPLQMQQLMDSNPGMSSRSAQSSEYRQSQRASVDRPV